MSDYIFKMRVVDKDPTGYYYVRWDKATPVEVVATSRAEAFRKVWDLMGPAPRHRTWTAQIDSMTATTTARAEAVVKAEALREAADYIERSRYGAPLPVSQVLSILRAQATAAERAA